jgi:hypothetical protein
MHQNPATTLQLKVIYYYLVWSWPGQRSRYSDSLRTGRSGDRIPVGARYSAPVQTGFGAHPASYTMVTRSFPGVKRPGRGVDSPPPSSVNIKERVELFLYSISGLSWPVKGWTLPFTLLGMNQCIPFNNCNPEYKTRFVTLLRYQWTTTPYSYYNFTFTLPCIVTNFFLITHQTH